MVLPRRGDPERRRQQLDVGPAQVDLEDGENEGNRQVPYRIGVGDEQGFSRAEKRELQNPLVPAVH